MSGPALITRNGEKTSNRADAPSPRPERRNSRQRFLGPCDRRGQRLYVTAAPMVVSAGPPLTDDLRRSLLWFARAVSLRIAPRSGPGGLDRCARSDEPSSAGAEDRSPGASAPGPGRTTREDPSSPARGDMGGLSPSRPVAPVGARGGGCRGRPRRPPGLTHPGYDLSPLRGWGRLPPTATVTPRLSIPVHNANANRSSVALSDRRKSLRTNRPRCVRNPSLAPRSRDPAHGQTVISPGRLPAPP